MKLFRKLMKNEKGATAIEYGLIAALISVALVGAASSLGGTLSGTFENIDKQMTPGTGA